MMVSFGKSVAEPSFDPVIALGALMCFSSLVRLNIPGSRSRGGEDWPGNIRELQNLIERAVIVSKDGVLSNPLPMPDSQSLNSCPFPTTLKEVERTTILSALEDRGWVVGGSDGAAAKLGVPRTTLIYKMERFGICRPVASEAAL